jgi:hypothetical protein
MGRSAVYALAVNLCLRAAATHSMAVTPSTISGVGIEGPSSPDYESDVEKILGTARPDALNELLRYGVVVKNGTTQTIVGVALRWDLVTDKGAKATWVKPFEAFDQRARQIGAGKSVVALPTTVLADASHLPQFQAGNPPMFKTAESVRVSLDGVVFYSGQFVGPNTAHVYEGYQANTTIPPQVATKVLAMKSSGVPVGDVVAWLEAAANPGHVKDAPVAVTARAARQLLRVYKQRGESSLFKAAQSESEPVINLYR